MGSAAVRDSMDEVVYRRGRHVVSENERCVAAAEALKLSDYVTFGQLMTASHRSLRLVLSADFGRHSQPQLGWDRFSNLRM